MMNEVVQQSPTFQRVAELLAELVGGADLLVVPITADTTFHEDLQLESVDLVTFAGILDEEFGGRVNLPAYLSELDLSEVIDLRVGDIVDYVSSRVDGDR
ncbi:acyl carrier protein [Fodinicola acaciae]|uniref:acyl carrier protein n=1 Tax=Fodinicola acaciae TaxID=2681555 RepID=UPI0013D80868|nr:acyl carrier protein [Fodinicola acaciae]